nr:immunoglobulin light chain junction region [Macaca mulatta]
DYYWQVSDSSTVLF